jgi:hypothetical protein
MANQLRGVVLKDNADDLRRLQHYFDTVVHERARTDPHWKVFRDAGRKLWP